MQRSQSERYRTRSIHYASLPHSASPSPRESYETGQEVYEHDMEERSDEDSNNSFSFSSSPSLANPNPHSHHPFPSRYASHSLSFHGDVFDDDDDNGDNLVPCYSACMFM